MPTWAWISLAVIVFVPCWRATFRDMHEDMQLSTVGELVGWSLVAVLCSFMGPVFMAQRSRLLKKDASGIIRMLAGESPEQRRRQRENALRDRELRVAGLEKELGIGTADEESA